MIYELKRSMCFPVWTCRLLQENAHPSWGLALLAVRTAPVLVSLTSVNFSPFISSWHCTQQTRLALPQSSHPIQERKQASRVLFGSERVWGSWQGYSYHVAEHRDWLKYPPHLHPQPPPPEYTKPEVFRGDASRNENKVKWESQERKKSKWETAQSLVGLEAGTQLLEFTDKRKRMLPAGGDGVLQEPGGRTKMEQN